MKTNKGTLSFLIPEPPLLVLPTLANALGLNEGLLLQQFKYWLNTSKNVREGHKWIYNTYEDWQKQFPFWSIRTVRRTIWHLESKDILVSATFNKMKIDQTKWYRIDEDKLQVYIDEFLEHGKRLEYPKESKRKK